MKADKRLIFLMLFTLGLAANTFGQQSKIEGYLSKYDNTSIPSTKIVITPGGQAGTTDRTGHFYISLPDYIQPGQAARIRVEKANWTVFHPMFGECKTQSVERDRKPLKVIIVQKGSLLALSPKRISEVVARWATERSQQAQEINRLQSEVTRASRELDEDSFLKRYAMEYGFTIDKFIAAANQWAQIKDADDKEERALKEYWQKNYEVAALLALEAAEEADRELEQVNKQKLESSQKVLRRYLLAGESFFEKDKLREALAAFLEIDRRFETKRIDKEDFTEIWAGTKALIGNTKRQMGDRIEGTEGKHLLLEALAAFDQAVTILTRQRYPEQWAFVQEHVGDAMFSLGKLTTAKESIEFLTKALTAYMALEDFVRQNSQQNWALVHSKMGDVWAEFGLKTVGGEGLNYLIKAAAVYEDALKVLIHEYARPNWAATKTNLGNVMHELGERTEADESIEYLNKAMASYNDALTVYTYQRSPQLWARVQYNLGNSLLDLGKRTSGEERVNYLNRAITAYCLALKVRTFQKSPPQWQKTQHDLALAYIGLEDWSSAGEAFAKILQAFPDNREAYYKATAIYHQTLFNFEKAFALNQQWLARHKDDVGAQFIFAESHFTTARFNECVHLVNALLTQPNIPIEAKTALRALEIASLLAINLLQQVPGKFEALIVEIASQPTKYKVGWSCGGTRYFISNCEVLLAHRSWLGKLLDAIAYEDRDTMLAALQEVRASFKK